jgi:hypothetical protein
VLTKWLCIHTNYRFGLQLEGQEGFSVIKYDSTDEYLPHCDGDCTGVEYIPGGRYVTVIQRLSNGYSSFFKG